MYHTVKQILLAQKQALSTRVRESLIYCHQNVLPPLCSFSRGDGLPARTHSSVPDHVSGTWTGIRDTVLSHLHDCCQILILCPPPPRTLCTNNLTQGNVSRSPVAKGRSPKAGSTPRISTAESKSSPLS